MADKGQSGEAFVLRPAIVAREGEQEGEMSPRSGPQKVVSIAEPESISPIIQPLDNQPKKQFPAGVARRLSGRPPAMSSSRASIMSQNSYEDLPSAALPRRGEERSHKHHTHHHNPSHQDKLLTQVAEWLQAEKAKRAAKKSKKHQGTQAAGDSEADIIAAARSRTGSDASVMSLEKLQRILEDNMTAFGHEQLPAASPNLGPRRGSYFATPRRKSSSRNLSRTASSDTEYHDGDVLVPSCDEVLDNSKTLSYSGGGAASDLNLAATGKRAEKEAKAWSIFKLEILRLAHTLRLKGWRQVSLDNPDDIEVERLSGALTNAVYVVSPPKDIPAPIQTEKGTFSKKPPPKLLLRIYGPQVEHLIDRENELGILRRLARKKIGPRLLGTFRNGRFEEYFASTTLTSADLHVSETSKQIAKRMRELHDGIDLLDQERDDGPFVWRNWDKWVDRCEHVVTFLDKQILSSKVDPAQGKVELWKSRGLVCGVEWPQFRAMIVKYRKFLDEHYGGPQKISEKLVFAHNDTQYGNILRLKPVGESPLLLPANSHKQLVVIDFEYASANTPGIEFANHFTEWCYNYHDPVAPYACNHTAYPTVEEQKRFIRSYVNHRPQYNPRASATPKSTASPGPGSISTFMLDSRTPGGAIGNIGDGSIYKEEEERRELETNRKVEELMTETRIWRMANSAQWVAWGIVQAKVPELDAPGSAELVKEDEEDTEEEFDYLAYAQERAMFFWGDCVEAGLIKAEELPESVRNAIKTVVY